MKKALSVAIVAAIGFLMSQPVVAQPPGERPDAMEIDGLGEKPERGPGKRGKRGEKGARGEKGQRGGKDLKKMMEKLDANTDGQLSKDELPERMQRQFEKLDADSSGAVSVEELTQALSKKKGRGQGKNGKEGAGMEGKGKEGKGRRAGAEGRQRPNPAQLIERLDKDGNGKVSKAEMPEKLVKRFDQLDANTDGFVDLQELEAAAEKRAAKGEGKGKEKGKGKGRRGEGGDGNRPVTPKAPPTDFAP